MNGSLYLQVMQDRCVNCNECAIAVACPSRAFCRVSAERPYLMKQQALAVIRQKAEQADDAEAQQLLSKISNS